MSDFSLPVSDSVPQTIVDTLHKTIRRVRTVIAVKGLCATLAVLIAGLLGAMAIDAGVVIFAAWPRWVLSLSVLGLTLFTAWLFLFRPLIKSFTLTGMARMLEARHPEMQERLSSALQLLSSKDAPELRGSEQLIAALAGEANETAMGVQPKREVTLISTRPYVIAAGAVLAVLAGLLVLWPGKASTLLARAIAPNANIPNLRAGDLVITPGQDVVIAEGDRLAVTVLVKNSKVESASIRWAGANGAEQVEPMASTGTEGDNHRFTYTFAPAQGTFRYRINAGDALSAYFAATVVARPQARSVVIRYEYPAYTHLPPAQETGMQIKAVAGTLAKVTLQANKPLRSATLVIESNPRQLIARQDTPDRESATFLVPLTAKLRGAWTIELIDQNDFSATVGPYTIEALEDHPPVVKIVRPEKTPITLKRTDRLPIGYTMTDDFGLAAARITVEADNKSIKLAPVAINLAALPDGKLRRGVADTAILDLSRYELSDVRTLDVRVVAEDAMHNGCISSSITINLDTNAPTYATQIQLADELIIRQVLEQVFKDLTEGKKDSSALYKVMPNLETLNPPAIEKIERLRGILMTDEKALRDLADQLAGGSYAPLGDTLTALVKEHISVAAGEVAKLKLTDSKKDRAAGADVVDFEIDRSLAIVGELLKKLAVMTAEARRVQELSELAQKQDDLAAEKAMIDAAKAAKEAATQPGADSQPASQSATQPGNKTPFDAMTPEELEKASKQWQARQAAMAKQLAELARRTPGALGKRAKQREEVTRDLIADAKELANRQAAVANDAATASKVTELDKALKNLAERQTKLSEEAKQSEATKDVAETMKQAAGPIENAETEEALKKQAQIERQLKEQTVRNQKAKAATELAGQASALAQRQLEISKAVAAAAANADKAKAAANVADAKAKEQTDAADKTKAKLDNKLAELTKGQQELVKQSQDLEKKAAENPALATARDVKPSATMNEAAGQMKHETLPQSRGKAEQAAAEAKALADKMAQAAQAAKNQPVAPGTTPAAAKQAQDNAAAAEKTAKDAAKLAEDQARLAKELADLAAPAKQIADARAAAAAAAADAANQNRAHQDAKNQIAQQAGNQQQVADAAKEIIKQARHTTAAANAAVNRAMTKATKDVPAGDPKAVKSTEQAAEALVGLAKAIENTAGDKRIDPNQRQQYEQKVQEVSAKQAQIKDEAYQLLTQRNRLLVEQKQAHAVRLAVEQAAMAKKVAELSDKYKTVAPQEDRLELATARNAARADENLSKKNLPEAAREATTAGERLEELARRLGAELSTATQPTTRPQPTDLATTGPASRPTVAGSTEQEPDQLKTGNTAAQKRQALGEETAKLAVRQQQLAREMTALNKGRMSELVKGRQKDVSDATDDLAKDVGLVRDYSGDLVPDPNVKAAAEQAAAHMKVAQDHQAKATEHLAKNDPAQAVPSQQGAVGKLNEAAAALENLAGQLTAIANRDPSPKDKPEDEESGHLAKATDDAEEAAATKDQALAERAAKLLEDMTESASTRAQEMGVMPMDMGPGKNKDKSGMSGKQPNPLGQASRQVFRLTQKELDAMGITVGDWGLLKGELRDQVLQGAADKSPEEYRELIREYFDAVSRRGNETKK